MSKRLLLESVRLTAHPALKQGALAFALVPILLLAGCGAEERAEPAQARWRASKPGSRVGTVRAAVVERPSPDRALIEVQWEARLHAAHAGRADLTCELRILLPEGAFLLEGEAARSLASDEPLGRHHWLVQFPLGRPLDAVVTYCAETEAGPRAAEVAVRLTQDPNEDPN